MVQPPRKNWLVRLCHDPIWNNGALGFFEEGCPNKNKNKMSSDIRSVLDPQTAAHTKQPVTFVNWQLP